MMKHVLVRYRYSLTVILREVHRKNMKESVVVLALGDLGHSPRMQNQAYSLATQGKKHVDFVGFPGSTLHERICDHDDITVHHLRSFAVKYPNIPFVFVFFAAFKLLMQSMFIFWTLMFKIQSPSYIIVQSSLARCSRRAFRIPEETVILFIYSAFRNMTGSILWGDPVIERKYLRVVFKNPPTLPTLSVVQTVCFLRRCKFVIDWHNFGYTILSMRLGKGHPLVTFAKWYERIFAKGAYAHFCVSAAMKNFLKKEFGVTATVLRDCPTERFRRLSTNEMHELFTHLESEEHEHNPKSDYPKFREIAQHFSPSREDQDQWTEHTIFTYRDEFSEDKKAYLRPDRPVMIVSSTSYTEDEDFSVLLNAIKRLEDHQAEGSAGDETPKFLFIISGKGPKRKEYEDEIDRLDLKRSRVLTIFFDTEDYPKWLGTADLGVCLHKSSSGYDLPMKVVDMFGSLLPVLAIQFGCVGELVRDDENGLLFEEEETLARQIEDLFEEFPRRTSKIDSMRSKLKEYISKRWDDTWGEHALQFFQ